MALQERGSRWQRAAAVWVHLPAMLVAVSFSIVGYAQDMKVKRFRIQSTPEGAVVSTISGKRGVTPLSITERDIYPNNYPPEKIDLYGKVIISKAGCETVTRRVTLDDIKQVIDIQLDCAAAAPVAATKAPLKAAMSPRPEQAAKTLSPAATTTETLSARRLRQLKVLHELLEDGLISQRRGTGDPPTHLRAPTVTPRLGALVSICRR